GLAVELLERLLDDEESRIGTRGVKAGIVLVFGIDGGNERLVVGRIESGRVPAAGVDADRFLAHQLENAFVGARSVAEHGELALEPVFVELLEKAQRIDAGKTHIDAVDIGTDLRQERRVIRRVERRPELLHYL